MTTLEIGSVVKGGTGRNKRNYDLRLVRVFPRDIQETLVTDRVSNNLGVSCDQIVAVVAYRLKANGQPLYAPSLYYTVTTEPEEIGSVYDGVVRCDCGCKYWENDKCVGCGESVTVYLARK